MEAKIWYEDVFKKIFVKKKQFTEIKIKSIDSIFEVCCQLIEIHKFSRFFSKCLTKPKILAVQHKLAYKNFNRENNSTSNMSI